MNQVKKTTLPITGGCLCGQVRYQLTALPTKMAICHCNSCQKSTGSAFFPFLLTPAENFELSGEVKEYSQLGSSGQMVYRHFCPNCGSSLYGRLEVLPGFCTVAAGTLDDSQSYCPDANVWAIEAPSWSHIDASLETFEKNPS